MYVAATHNAGAHGPACAQVAAVGVEAALLRMEAELAQSAAQMSSWTSLMSGAVVALSSDMPASFSAGAGGASAAAAVVVSDGGLEPDVRLSMRQDLKVHAEGLACTISCPS